MIRKYINEIDGTVDTLDPDQDARLNTLGLIGFALIITAAAIASLV